MSLRRNYRVLLLLETSREYGRGLLRGIFLYSRLFGPWAMELQTPFYFADLKISPVETTPLDSFDGIISREPLERISRKPPEIPIIHSRYDKPAKNEYEIRTREMEISQCVARYYIDRGYRHYGYLGFPGVYWSDQREEAYRDAVEKAGFVCHVYTTGKRKSRLNWSAEQDRLAKWLESLPRPVALFCCNDDRGRQAVAACRSSGLHIPEEVALVGVDNDEFICNSTSPPLSSVALNLENAGFRAAQALQVLMEGAEPGNSTIAVEPTQVVTRQSSDHLAIEDPLVSRAVRFVRQNSRRAIQVADILQEVAVSRRTLYDRFKSVLGCSVHRYIKRVRVEHIETLLLQSDLSIEQIAMKMDFTSSDHIAQYFRSEKGVNPHAYRKLSAPR